MVRTSGANWHDRATLHTSSSRRIRCNTGCTCRVRRVPASDSTHCALRLRITPVHFQLLCQMRGGHCCPMESTPRHFAEKEIPHVSLPFCTSDNPVCGTLHLCHHQVGHIFCVFCPALHFQKPHRILKIIKWFEAALVRDDPLAGTQTQQVTSPSNSRLISI